MKPEDHDKMVAEIAKATCETYKELWGKSIDKDLVAMAKQIGNVTNLALMLNNVPNMRLLRIEGAELSVGGYRYEKPLKILMVYDLKESTARVPDAVRAEFLELVVKVDKIFPINRITIGFANEMTMKSYNSTTHNTVKTQAMLQIDTFL